MLETCQTLRNFQGTAGNSKNASQQNGRTRFERRFAMAGTAAHLRPLKGRFFRSIGLSDYLRISEMKEKQLLYLHLGVTNLLPVWNQTERRREKVKKSPVKYEKLAGSKQGQSNTYKFSHTFPIPLGPFWWTHASNMFHNVRWRMSNHFYLKNEISQTLQL